MQLERENLKTLDSMIIVDYIRTSIEILLNLQNEKNQSQNESEMTRHGMLFFEKGRKSQ